MAKTPNLKGKPKGKRLSSTAIVTIIVAALGCIGTVAAALITGLSLYLTTRTQIELPVVFTQTAQFKPTPEVSTFDWQSVVTIQPDTPCPAVYVADHLVAGEDKNIWIRDQLFGLYQRNELMYAPLLQFDASNDIRLYITLTNITGSQDWLKLSKELEISIRFLDDVPPASDIVQLTECGGGGSLRYFSPVPLNTDYPEYNVSSASEDADFYTLQPGEFEIFVLEFQCQSPGLYRLKVNIPINFQGHDETISFSDFPGFICPNHVNYSYGAPGDPIPSGLKVDIYNAEQYEWTGDRYKKISP